MRPDNNGLPIHGLLAAYPGWRAQQVSDQKPTAELISERTRNSYPAAQVFAPAGETVICFEPMTAPTDALRRGGYRGEPDITVFSIKVS